MGKGAVKMGWFFECPNCGRLNRINHPPTGKWTYVCTCGVTGSADGYHQLLRCLKKTQNVRSAPQVRTEEEKVGGKYYFEISVPYNSHFVGELKSGILAHAREWNAESKKWIIHKRYEGFVRALIDRYFGVKPIATRSVEGLERLVVLP